MKALFVTPNPSGSGEAITAMQLGRQLTRSGHEVRFFTEHFPCQFLAGSFPRKVAEFSDNAAETGTRWRSLLRDFRPSAVIFADYPLLFLRPRGRMLVEGENGKALEGLEAQLFTLDHLGMARGPLRLSFGPPHLELKSDPCSWIAPKRQDPSTVPFAKSGCGLGDKFPLSHRGAAADFA
jgi:hypothetical protein